MAASSTGSGASNKSRPMDPELWRTYDRAYQEKLEALRDPGPSWREWFFFRAAKWYIGLGFLMIDGIVAVQWFELGSYLGLGLSLAGALYLEYLLWEYLWFQPEIADLPRRGERFRGTWRRPVLYGRWTPEADQVRAGTPLVRGDAGPDPREFL